MTTDVSCGRLEACYKRQSEDLPLQIMKGSMKLIIATCLVLLTVVAVLGAQKSKYGVTVTAEKNVDFAKFKTYSWTRGRPSPNKTIDARIVAAVNRELSALGMMIATSGPGDVLATYDALARTDIDPTKAARQANPTEYSVGSLTVTLLNPGNRQPLLRLRTDKPIDDEPAKRDQEIDLAVTELFASYPTRKRE